MTCLPHSGCRSTNSPCSARSRRFSLGRIPLFLSRRESLPERGRSRLQFRYHIYRTIYFLEQGSVKGVKKEVKSSSDLFLLFADETDDDIDALLRIPANGRLSLALDSFTAVTRYDGYLPLLLKSRLEFRRGNSLKILTLLNQIYDETPEETRGSTVSLVPEKDYFYYSMIAAVFFATERVAVGFHFLLRALQAGIPAVPHHQDARERHVDVVTLGTLFQNLGLFCAELQDDKNALDFYQQAMKLLPENPVLLFRVGEFHFQRAMQRPDSRGEAAPGSMALRNNPFILLRDGLPALSPAGDGVSAARLK